MSNCTRRLFRGGGKGILTGILLGLTSVDVDFNIDAKFNDATTKPVR